MRKSIALLIGLMTIPTGLCWAASGIATINGTTEGSELSGTLKFEEMKQGLKIFGEIENVPPGYHGFHIHEFGDCSEEGKAAGGHYNPAMKSHGYVVKDGLGKAHVGDMGNLEANDEGVASISLIIPNVNLAGGKYNVAGRAIIIHEKKDDFGQPTGNAGGRIGCGPIVLTQK